MDVADMDVCVGNGSGDLFAAVQNFPAKRRLDRKDLLRVGNLDRQIKAAWGCRFAQMDEAGSPDQRQIREVILQPGC